MKPDNYNNYNKHFRRISHPRKNLQLPPESIEYLNSKGIIVPNVNPSAVFMELINYYEPHDTGLDIGKKEIRHSEYRGVYNKLFFKWYRKPSKYETCSFTRREWNREQRQKYKAISDTKLNADKIYAHITRQKTIYGTMNPFSPIRVLGGDIDNNTDNPELVLPFLHLFQSFYPRSFHDGGSSGKSLHYYPKIYMLPLYEYYCQNTDISCEWPEYANIIILHTSRIFRIYSHNIFSPEHTLKTKMSKNGKIRYVPKYHVHFDAFKASYPEYDFYRDDDGTPHPTEMIKNGVLHKLPNIFTVDDLITFRDAPVYSIIHHLAVSVYLCNTILLSGSYSDKDYKKLTSALHEIEPILVAHSVLLPSQAQAKNIVALSPTTPCKTIAKKESIKELCLYNSTFEDITDIALESDAMLRSRRYLYYCFTQYMTQEGREPTIEEYKQDYRDDVGTGEENPEDRKRLEYIYNTNISKMRKYFYGSISPQIQVMENKLDITQDDIDKLSTYDGKIRKRDVAITAVWMEYSLCNADYIGKKKWCSMNKGEHYTRELTVPMVALKGFFDSMKDKELSKYGCNDKKAKALREILENMKWFQCVDDSVVIASLNGGKGGRSRRYILLPDHPNYKKFEGIVGKDRIEYWKNFRQEQLRLRGLKTRSRKVG